MIQEYILNPFLTHIFDNIQLINFIDMSLIILLALSFLFTLERGVIWVWSKLYTNF